MNTVLWELDMENQEQLFEQIERYLRGLLNQEEKLDFEKRMQENPSFREEVELHQTLETVIQDKNVHALKQTLDESWNTFKKQEERSRNSLPFFQSYYFKLAAVLLLLVLSVATIWELIQPKSNQEYYAEYFSPYEARAFTRSDSDSVTFALREALGKYEREEYRESLEGLNEILAGDSSQVELYLYIGICHMVLDEELEALSSFKVLIDQGNELFLTQAHWYTALTYLKEDQVDSARAELKRLSGMSGVYKKKADELLELLQHTDT